MSNSQPTSSAKPVVTRETALYVLWQYGNGGYPPGDWTASLLTLIDRADKTNQAKLAQAYPGESEAIRMAKYDEDGIERLKQIAAQVTV